MKWWVATQFILWALLSHAQSPARTGTDHAIFFVVQDFDAWPDFPNSSTQQVRDIEQELKDNYGFKTELLLNPTRKQIVDKLTKDLAKRSFQKDDQLLVYFSMHGHYEEDSQGALIPKDGLSDDPSFDSWITHPNLAAWLNMIPCEHVLLSLDACYSGTFGGSRGAKPDKKPWEMGNDCASKAAKALQYKSRLYVTSGGVERTPTDSQLAKKWLEALRVRNTDGMLSFHSLFGVLSEASPVPMFGSFGSHAPGGDFAMIDKSSCSTKALLNDADHWKQLAGKKSRESVLHHLSQYPGCPHEMDAIALLSDNQSDAWTDSNGTWSDKNGIPADLPGFVYIPGGTFQMGSNDGDNDEKPVHQVTVSDFYLAITELTFDEYDAYCVANGTSKIDDEGWGRGKLPIINISWIQAVNYCNWRSKSEGLQEVYVISSNNVSANWNADGYRLPTEAEWEYAARSQGKDFKYAWGVSSVNGNVADETAKSTYSDWPTWNGYNDGYLYTSPTDKFQQGDLGLFNMTGNVWEWCWDWKAEYPSGSQINPHGPETGGTRVLRGGSWSNPPSSQRCTNRYDFSPFSRNFGIGFRLARSVR